MAVYGIMENHQCYTWYESTFYANKFHSFISTKCLIVILLERMPVLTAQLEAK